MAEADGSINTVRDGTKTIYFWGFQFEQSPYPTTYIKTEGAAGQRAADALSYPTAGNLTANDVIIDFDYIPFHEVVTGDLEFVFINYVDANNTTSIRVGTGGNIEFIKKIAGVENRVFTAWTPTIGVPVRVTAKLSSTLGMSISVDGGPDNWAESAADMPLGAAFEVGSRAADGRNTGGCIRFFQIRDVS
jgi:hypothetical protein